MKTFELINPETEQPIFEYKISFFPDDYEALHIIHDHVIFYGHETTKTGLFLSDQIEIPLAALDVILATIPRYDLPAKLGGLGGLHHADPIIINGEELYFKKYLHPHYGIETYEITNFNRGSHIDPQQRQSKQIFKETMDGGLLEKLIEINKDFHDGVYG